MSDRDVVVALLDAFQARDYDAARALISPDFSVTTHVGNRVVDREGYIDAHRPLETMFPDLEREVLDAREVGPGEVRVEMRLTATNNEPISIPSLDIDLPDPTGRVLHTVPHVDLFQVRDGLITTYHSEQPPGSGLRGLLDQIAATGESTP